jgi:FkbM family methyltransferase
MGQLSFKQRLLRLVLKTRLRGNHRLTMMLAGRIKEFQTVPIQIADWPAIYVDLRRHENHDWLARSPWLSCPRELPEQNVMRQIVRPGDVVYDIGAHAGLHTALLARLVGASGTVIAFEPNPERWSTLDAMARETVSIQVFPCALSDRGGSATLYVADDDSMTSLADWTRARGGCSHEASCRYIPLDQLAEEKHLPYPAFVKCDVEGAEVAVFRGAERMLDRDSAPIILFEANIHATKGFGVELASARDFLRSLPRPGYSFFDVLEEGIQPLERLHPVHSNILAVPRTRLHRVAEIDLSTGF